MAECCSYPVFSNHLRAYYLGILPGYFFFFYFVYARFFTRRVFIEEDWLQKRYGDWIVTGCIWCHALHTGRHYKNLRPFFNGLIYTRRGDCFVANCFQSLCHTAGSPGKCCKTDQHDGSMQRYCGNARAAGTWFGNIKGYG